MELIEETDSNRPAHCGCNLTEDGFVQEEAKGAEVVAYQHGFSWMMFEEQFAVKLLLHQQAH